VVGVDARGRIVWRDRKAARTKDRGVCLARCPDAILSGSLKSLIDPNVADPALRIHVAHRLTLVGHPELKRRVIWARSPGDTVSVDAEQVRLEFASPTETTLSRPIGDVGTVMLTDPSQRRGWTYSLTGPAVTLRWLKRGRGRWHIRGKPLTGADACASFDVRRALILRRRPLLVAFGASSGRKVSVDRRVPRALPTGCEVSRDGFLLSQVDPGNGSVRGIVSLIGRNGHLRWQRSYRHQAFGLALVTPRLTAVLAGTTLSAIGDSGRVLAKREVADVQRIGPNEFVILTPGGRLASLRLPDLKALALGGS